MREILRNFLVYLAILACFVLACLLLSGCKTQYVTVPEYHTIVQHDTVQHVDSVWRDRVQKEYIKGDTVYRTDSVFLYRYKYIDKVQEVQVTDSVPYPVEVQVPVRVRNGYDKFTSWGFWILFILILAFTAFKIVKWYFIRK